MLYNFKKRKHDLDRVVFALTLDNKRMVERVVVGNRDDVHLRLESDTGDVYYDKIRPIGSLLFYFEGDKDDAWNRNATILQESYAKVVPTERARWKLAASVSEFLLEKYNSGEPSAMFAAIRTWEDYLLCFHMNHASDVLNDKLSVLHKPFKLYREYKPWEKDAADILRNAYRDGEAGIELWYPVKKRPFESVVTSSSLIPLFFHYRYKTIEWRLVFQKCKICNSMFLAKSGHYELCSDGCRKTQAAFAKREFYERTKDDEIEAAFNADYNYWYNRLRRLRKDKEVDIKTVAAFKAAFDAHRKEAVKRKAAVKRGEITRYDFTNWMFKEQGKTDIHVKDLSQS
jgi:hypothetical protein